MRVDRKERGDDDDVSQKKEQHTDPPHLCSALVISVPLPGPSGLVALHAQGKQCLCSSYIHILFMLKLHNNAVLHYYGVSLVPQLSPTGF